jgi:hypothetical protein
VKVDLFCVFIHLGLSFLVMFIMKTSHKRDELKKIKKRGGVHKSGTYGWTHRGSQLYFHITRYVLKRRRENTFWGTKSESRVSAPFFASKTV